MEGKKFRVNYRQGKAAITQVHRITKKQPKQCYFDKMVDYVDYDTIDDAIADMKAKGKTSYKDCNVCWDGQVHNI